MGLVFVQRQDWKWPQSKVRRAGWGTGLQGGELTFSFIFLTPCQVDQLHPSKGSVLGVATSTEV